MADPVNHQVDLCIVGGGIHGASVARDAAKRGLSVHLFEKRDFGWATSSQSSKLIHGGLRYLEKLEFGLVREALRERAILLRMSPSSVRPLRFIIPHFRSARRSRWMFRAGLWLYDFMSFNKQLPEHGFLKSAEVRERMPWMFANGLQGASSYYDCQMDDARLVLENIVDAEHHGASCWNYHMVESIEQHGDTFVVEANDVLGSGRRRVEARALVNAAGPWVDQVANHALGEQRAQIRQAKGVHLLVDGLPVKDGVLLEVPDENRIFFTLPWRGLTLVGTTDTEYQGSAESIEVTTDDMGYLYSALDAYVHDDWKGKIEIRALYAGVRPLVEQHGKSTQEMSRRHLYEQPLANYVAIVGAKYTIYRAVGENVVDRLAPFLNCKAPSTTRRDPLPAITGGIAGRSLSEAVPWPLNRKMIEHHFRYEKVRHLSDLLMRRTPLHYVLNREKLDRVLHDICEVAYSSCGWDRNLIERQRDEYLHIRSAMEATIDSFRSGMHHES